MRECLGVGWGGVHTCNQRPSQCRLRHGFLQHTHIIRARAHTHKHTHTNRPVTLTRLTYTRTHTFFFFRCKGAVELVDASEMLPDLERRPGWKSWKVLDEDLNDW